MIASTHPLLELCAPPLRIVCAVLGRRPVGHRHAAAAQQLALQVDVFVQEALSQVAEFVPLCPEVAIGMGIPRESIRLVEDDDGEIKLLGTRSKQEWTAPMQRYAHEIAQWLEEQDICGFIFSKNSPSCGLFRVKIYNPKGSPSRRDGRGLFSEIITQHHPLLPVEEGGRGSSG